ncbi:unnamed protein product [Ectocarpus sp. 12 AP-2014]
MPSADSPGTSATTILATRCLPTWTDCDSSCASAGYEDRRRLIPRGLSVCP